MLNLIAMYKALGGGWQSQDHDVMVSKENLDSMKQRVDWGDLLTVRPEENESVTKKPAAK